MKPLKKDSTKKVSITDYMFSGIDKCKPNSDGSPGAHLNWDTLKKYKKHNPYHIKELLSKDSIHISFKFITSCCLDPDSNLIDKGDTIILKADFAGNMLCDCYCDYFFRYSFPIKGYGDKTILVN